MDKTTRAVIRGSRLFNTLLGLPRTGRNITSYLGTVQSGSPPGAGHARLWCWFVAHQDSVVT
jgi:hypothetical protein